MRCPVLCHGRLLCLRTHSCFFPPFLPGSEPVPHVASHVAAIRRHIMEARPQAIQAGSQAALGLSHARLAAVAHQIFQHSQALQKGNAEKCPGLSAAGKLSREVQASVTRTTSQGSEGASRAQAGQP